MWTPLFGTVLWQSVVPVEVGAALRQSTVPQVDTDFSLEFSIKNTFYQLFLCPVRWEEDWNYLCWSLQSSTEQFTSVAPPFGTILPGPCFVTLAFFHSI